MKQSAEENELRIESEIGRNVADYIFNKAKEKSFYMNSRREPLLLVVALDSIAEICNQPPPVEKEMTAAELVEKLKEHYEKSKRYWLSCHSKSGVEFKGINGGALIEYAESLLKQNSEGKES